MTVNSRGTLASRRRSGSTPLLVEARAAPCELNPIVVFIDPLDFEFASVTFHTAGIYSRQSGGGAGRAEFAPAEDEATQPASPVHARDAQAPNDARSDAGDAKDDSDDEEFHDALDKPPEDATMPARPRRSVMPHQRDDFVYY
ncbi:hypothetical protein MTO96_040694 [Rhipicephalus appendiculatus]